MSRRLTTEEFLQKLKDRGYYKEDYDYSKAEYIDYYTKIIIIYKKFDTEHLIPPSMLYNENGCIIKNATEKNKYFKKRLEEIHGDRYDHSKVVYVNSQTKVIIIDKGNNIEHALNPNTLMWGTGNCSIKSTINKTEHFLQKLKDKGYYNKDYDYSEVNYTDDRTKVIVIDKRFKTKHMISPNTMLNGVRCSIKNATNKNDYFIIKSNLIHDNRYKYPLFNFTSARSKIEIECEIHGIFKQRLCNHLDGIGWPQCGGSCKLTNKEFIERSREAHDNYYSYPSTKYINNKSMVEITCPIHGLFKQLAGSHLSGRGCSICKLSKGEINIKNILDNLNITYKRQKKFKDCKNIKNLSFDFYVPEINLLIEYSGMQHYKSTKGWGGEKDFKLRQLRDQIKVDYCKNNNINLLIIPYTEFNNIESIIKDKVI